MASMSLPATIQMDSPFDSDFGSPSLSPKSHGRRVSRNINAAPLPIFSFSPGTIEQSKSEDWIESSPPSEQPLGLNMTSRRASKPQLPEFRFNPGADLPVEPLPSPTHPVLQEMALNQRRVSRSARPAPLSSFTFPSNPNSAQPSPSPTKSAFSEVSQPARNSIGHRRRGSEFVGGGTDGILISGSPDKMDTRLSSPPISGVPRGHAHRRSQAVSISDIETSDLIKASAMAKARAGSTPTTPSDINQTFNLGRGSPPSRHSISYRARSPSSPNRASAVPGVRPRVGFADHVDVIPRPLSLISSETEGSSSTIRYGHSLSGSVNSIASPSPRRVAPITPPAQASTQQRPRTADFSTLLSSNAQGIDDPTAALNIPKRPLSASGSPCFTSSGSPPNKKKHFWFSPSNNSSPISTPKEECSDPIATMPTFAPAETTEKSRPRTSPERSASLKKRKYHTWTSGIFSRKPGKRPSKLKSKRTPTPPGLTRRVSDKVNEVFDEDETIVLREPSPVVQRRSSPQQPVLSPPPAWQYNETTTQVASPILDLDAALGPFGSEERLMSDSSSRSAASRIAKLHSSERRGSVDAFGSVHRRTESAPSMPAINRAAVFGLHRIGSNTSLVEEVFDEEEEDNFLAGKSSRSDDVEMSPKTVAIPEPRNLPDQDLAPAQARSFDGLGLSMKSQEPDGVMIVDEDDDFVHIEDRSSKSTIEAPVFPDHDMMKRPSSSPMAFAYPAPQSHYASSTEGRTTSASMISSPDPDNITFENLPRHVRYLEEPSPDMILRASNDDLPSLSDSISSGAIPRISSSVNTRSSVEHRSNSMFVSSTSKSSQTWKRSSLASLNRLIPGSSNGSKLKFETVPDIVPDERSRKKSNRLSKLMHFWRSKEKGDV